MCSLASLEAVEITEILRTVYKSFLGRSALQRIRGFPDPHHIVLMWPELLMLQYFMLMGMIQRLWHMSVK